MVACSKTETEPGSQYRLRRVAGDCTPVSVLWHGDFAPGAIGSEPEGTGFCQ